MQMFNVVTSDAWSLLQNYTSTSVASILYELVKITH